MGNLYLCLSNDVFLIKLLKQHIPQGVKVDFFRDPLVALKQFSPLQHMLLLLDEDLPGKTGLDVISDLRSRSIDTPVILICNSADMQKSLAGWDVGADVVVSKPVNPELLFARAKALLNRHQRAQDQNLYISDATLRENDQALIRDGRRIDLARREYAILRLLARNKGHVVHRQLLHDSTQKYNRACTDNVLDVHISNIRKKLRAAGLQKRTIQTVYGVGYKLDTD